MEDQPTTGQKYLGKVGLILFLAAISMFPVLSTDLYLPALPNMIDDFIAPEYQVNLTLTLFFVFYAVGLLVWGPLSDRFGRRPVILVGMGAYAVGGLLCAFSGNVLQLIVWRVFQALGAAAGGTVGTAVVKDVYEGRKRDLTLAVVQSMVVLSPLVAPILGSQILRVASWRAVFIVQGAWGSAMLLAGLAYQETLRDRLVGNPLASLKRLAVVFRNRDFALMLTTFTIGSMSSMAFIAASSYIYQVTFGLSEQGYGFFFALFGAFVAIGPPLYIVLSRWFERTTIVTWCLAVSLALGVLVMTVGPSGPWALILTYGPTAISMSCLRPPATYIMLDQHEADAGSVSGIILAAHMSTGSIMTVVVSLNIWGRVELVGALTAGLALLSLGLWLLLGLPLARAQAAASGSAVSEVSGS